MNDSNWPKHFPDKCPPEDAWGRTGEIYRFVNRRTFHEKDFYTFYELNPGKDWKEYACQSRGLSIFLTKEDCHNMAMAVPAMRKKKIVCATLDNSSGLISKTPSNNSEEHHTFWSLLSASELLTMFKLIEEVI